MGCWHALLCPTAAGDALLPPGRTPRLERESSGGGLPVTMSLQLHIFLCQAAKVLLQAAGRRYSPPPGGVLSVWCQHTPSDTHRPFCCHVLRPRDRKPACLASTPGGDGGAGCSLQSVLVTAQGKGSVMAPSSDLRRVLQRWAGVARLWWRCPSERRRAWAFVAACVALSITNVGLLLWISYVQNALQTSLSEKQQGERAARGCRRRRHGPPTPRHTLPIAPCDSIPPPRCLTCTPRVQLAFIPPSGTLC